jgi:hypothetical protein
VLEIAEWRVKVEAIVLDLEGTDFDVVFWGWNGFQSGIHRTKRIHCQLTTPKLQDFDIDNPEIQADFNLIGYDKLEEHLRNKLKKDEDQVQTGLYFVRLSHPEEQLNAIEKFIEPDYSVVVETNPELQAELDEFSDVFRNSLPQGLRPQWDVDHVINPQQEPLSNQNAYQLSVIQLEEQTKQIDALLRHGLKHHQFFRPKT